MFPLFIFPFFLLRLSFFPLVHVIHSSHPTSINESIVTVSCKIDVFLVFLVNDAYAILIVQYILHDYDCYHRRYMLYHPMHYGLW